MTALTLAATLAFAAYNGWIFWAFSLNSSRRQFELASRWFDRLKIFNPLLGGVVGVLWAQAAIDLLLH